MPLNSYKLCNNLTDCQFFYVCIDGTQPRRTSCGPGLVYSNETASCERQEKVKDPVSLRSNPG